MQRIRLSLLLLTLLFLTACVTTTGEIKGNQFYLENYFNITLLDSDWEVVRQQTWVQYGVKKSNTMYEISFRHKKSNGIIGVNSYWLDEVGKTQSLDIHANEAVAEFGGMKLSQKIIKVDGIDAVELVISGNYMFKYIFLKKGDKGYGIIYRNTPAYFDEYLSVFDKFVGTFRAFY
ncbi:MAG: hypothetical protein HY756_01120 [Nitrospirae bacterium]|nr:hypothetical protein [Nitrospirota bacterium]